MELAAFGALEACAGRFLPPPSYPGPPVQGTPVSSHKHHDSCSGVFSSRQDSGFCKRHSGNSTECDKNERREWLVDLEEQQQYLSDRVFGSQQDPEQQHRRQQQQWPRGQLQDPTSRRTRQPDPEVKRETCEDFVFGVDIPEAGAHITCFVRDRTLEVYDSSPHSRFVCHTQAGASASVASAIVAKEASPATAVEAAAFKAPSSAHVEEALAQAAAAAPVLPCLLRLDLPAPLLSPELFDAVLIPNSTPRAAAGAYCQRRACGTRSIDSKAATGKESSIDSSCSIDGHRSSCNEQDNRHSGTGAGGSNSTGRSHTEDDDGASSDFEGSSHTIQDATSVEADCCDVEFDAVSTGVAGNFTSMNRYVCDRLQTHSVSRHALTANRSQGTTAVVHTMVKEKLGSSEGTGTPCTSVAALTKGDAGVWERTAEKPSNPGSDSPRERQKKFTAAVTRFFGANLTKRHSHHSWPAVTLCFMLANGELHRMQLILSEALSRQQQPCRMANIAEGGARCAETIVQPQDKLCAEVARPGQQLLLLVQNHISIMLTRDVLLLQEETVAVQCCGKHELRARGTVEKATFFPFDCFLTPPAPREGNRGLPASPQHDDQQPMCVFEQREREQWRRSKEGQTQDGEQVSAGGNKYFCEAGEQQGRPAAGEASTDHVLASGIILRTTTTALSVGSCKVLGSTISRVGPPLRLLLLHSGDVLLELSEPRVYGVLQFRKFCISRRRRRCLDTDSRRSTSKHSTRVKCGNPATSGAPVGADTDIRERANRNTMAEGRQARIATGEFGISGEATDCSAVFGQLRRSVCSRRKRSFSSCTSEGLSIWRALTSSWTPWKRPRVRSVCRTSADHVEFAPASPSRKGDRSNSNEDTAQGQHILKSDNSITSTVNLFSCRPVNYSREAGDIPCIAPTNAFGAESAAHSSRLGRSSGARGAEQGIAATLMRKLMPTRVVPYLLDGLVTPPENRKPLEVQESHDKFQEALYQQGAQRTLAPGYVQGDAADSQPESRDAHERRESAAVSTGVFIERHRRRPSSEEISRRCRIRYLWATSQHVVRLPRAADGPAEANDGMQRGDSLLVTCSVVSVPRPQRQSCVGARCAHGSRESEYHDISDDEGGRTGGCIERRGSVFSNSTELEAPKKTDRLCNMVVVAVWKTRAVCSSRVCLRAACGVAHSSTESTATSKNNRDISTVQRDGEPLRMHRRIRADRTRCAPSLHLLCEYTYVLDDVAAKAQEIQIAAAAPSTLTASAAHRKTTRTVRKTAPMTSPGALSRQHRDESGLLLLTRKREEPPSDGLTRREAYQQSEEDTDLPPVTSTSCSAAAATQMELNLLVESVHVSAAATTTVPAAPAPATAGCGAGWWIGVALRYTSENGADVRSKDVSDTSRDRNTGDRSEGTNSSSDPCTQRRSNGGSCCVSTHREFLLLRCFAKGTSRDNWRLERAGQLFGTPEEVLCFPAVAKGCKRALESCQCSQDTFHKSRPDESVTVGHLDDKSVLLPSLVAEDRTISEEREDYNICQLKQQDEVIRWDGCSEFEDLRKQHYSRRQQRRGLPQTEFLLTSTHLWLFTTKASTTEYSYGQMDRSGEDQQRYIRGNMLGIDTRPRPFCCCPRPVAWAVPLPDFNPPHCASSASAFPVLPQISDDTTAGCIEKERTKAGGDAAAEQRPVWPAGMEPFRVLRIDDLRCSNACCSAIFRNRSREVAETAHIVTLLSRLRAAVRSVLRRCLAAVASSAAEPLGPGGAAAAGATTAAAVWNYQPLVTDAYPTVFPDVRRNSTEAAAVLLDWVAFKLTTGLMGCDVYRQSSGVAATEKATSDVLAETAVPAGATSASVAGVGGKPQAPEHTYATATAERHPGEVATIYVDMETEDAEPRHDLLVALLSEYSVLLHGKEAEAQTSTARMETLFSALGSVTKEKTSTSAGGEQWKRHCGVVALSSRVRLVLELLTDSLCRNGWTSRPEHRLQDGKRIDQQKEEEVVRQWQTELQHRPQQQQRSRPANHPEQGEWNAFTDRLTVASIVSLVLCWHSRRILRRCAGASGSPALPSGAIVGGSLVWGGVLQQFVSRLSAASSTEPYSLSYTKLQTPLRSAANGNSSACPQCALYSSSNYSVEEALLHSPLECALAGGFLGSSDTGMKRAMHASGPDPASMCGRMSSQNTAPVEFARCLAASHSPPVAVPLIIYRHGGNAHGASWDSGAPPAAGLMLPRRVRESSCYSLSVIRPALTVAEKIDWQLKHNLKEAAFDAAQTTIAAAAEEQETSKERNKGCLTGDLRRGRNTSLYDRQDEEAAEADADCLALGSLLNRLTLSERIWHTVQRKAVSATAARDGATAEDVAFRCGAEVGRVGAGSSQQYCFESSVHQNSARYTETIPQSHFSSVLRQNYRASQRVPYSATGTAPTKPSGQSTRVTEGGSDSLWEVELGTSFFREFLSGKGSYIFGVEQFPCCYCSSRSSKLTEAQRRTQELLECPPDYPTTVRAAAMLQRRRQELIERLQHVLRLSNSMSWQLAAVGSFLRLGAAAVVAIQQDDKEPQSQLQRQQEPQRPTQPPDKYCGHPLAAGGRHKGQSTGEFVSEGATSISEQTGTSTGQSTIGMHCCEEKEIYTTSSSTVWKRLQELLYERPSSLDRHWRGIKVYSAYVLSCAAAAVAPLAVACVQPGQSVCGSRAAVAPAQLPVTLSEKVATGGQAEPLVTLAGASKKLLQRIRCSSLLPVCLDKRVLRHCFDDSESVAGAGTGGEVGINCCRYPIAMNPTSAAADKPSPVQLQVTRGGAVLLLHDQPNAIFDLDTLSDANIAAVSPAPLAEVNAALPEGTQESTAAGHAAAAAAAAAVAARVGLECAPFLRSPDFSHGYASCAPDMTYWQQEREKVACASERMWSSVAVETMRNTDGSDSHLPNSSSLKDFQQDGRQNQPQWMLEAQAATASQGDMESFLSFIASPVHRVLANAVRAGIVAQHELLCNLAGGAWYLQKLLLQRQEQQGQEDVRGKTQEHRQARNGPQELQQEPKQQPPWQLSGCGGRGLPSDIHTANGGWCFACIDAADAKRYADSIFQTFLAAHGIAPCPASRLGTCLAPTEQEHLASKRQRLPSAHADDTNREWLTQNWVPSPFLFCDQLIYTLTGSATCPESELLSSILQALDASNAKKYTFADKRLSLFINLLHLKLSLAACAAAVSLQLPLAAGLRCLFETPKAPPCTRVLPEQQQRRLQSSIHLQEDRQPDAQRAQMASKNVNVSGHFREVEGATDAGQCRCCRLLTAGDEAAATACHSPRASLDVKEERSPYTGCQLLLFMMFGQYARGRFTFVSSTKLRHRKRSNRAGKKSRMKETSRSCSNSAKGGLQTTKSETEAYIRQLELFNERSLTSSAATDCTSETPDSAPEQDVAPVAAASKTLSAHSNTAPACATGATQAAFSSFGKVDGMLLLLPCLVRSLCDCQLLKTVLVAQRIRAASRLADFLFHSPSTLHRLAAHSLRCWTYRERCCVFRASSSAAAGVYSEIQAASWHTARLLSSLQQRTLKLSHVAAGGQHPLLQEQEQRPPVVSENHHSKQQRTHVRGQHSRQCMESDEEGGGGEREEQGWHHGQEGLGQQAREQQREQWRRQGQECKQQQQGRQQQEEEVVFCVLRRPGHQDAVRQQQRTYIVNQRRGARHAAAEQQDTASENGISGASFEDRISEAYCWGCYAQLLHHTACRLQQFYPEIAALLLELCPDQCICVSSYAFKNEADPLAQHPTEKRDILFAAARGNLSHGCNIPESVATASTTTQEAADEAEARAEPASAAHLSIAEAVLQTAALAAATSSRIREGLLQVLTAPSADGRRPCPRSSPRCSAQTGALGTPDDGQSLAINKNMRREQARALQRGREVPETRGSGAHFTALLHMCCSILPAALPDAAELWEAALTAALQDGNVAAATTLLPMLRWSEHREEHLLRILAALLIQQSPGSAEWGGKTAHFLEASRTPVEKQTCVSRHGKGRTLCGDAERNNGFYRSRHSSDADLVTCTRGVHRLQNAESVSLAAVRAASRLSQQRLSVEAILLRLCISAGCGREGPALAAFQLLKKDFLSSGRRSDAALLAFLHAAAVQAQLYATSATYLSAAATASPHTTATWVAVEAATSRHYADMIATDECFPSWLLWELKQLQDVGQQQQEAPSAAAFERNHSASQVGWESAGTSTCPQISRQPNHSSRHREMRVLENRQGRQGREGAEREEYKEHLRLMEAAEKVRRLCLTFVSEGRWIDKAQPPFAAAAAATAPSSDIAAELVKSAISGQAAAAAGGDAARERAARTLCSQFQKSLSLVHCSASLCANLLFDVHVGEPSGFLSSPFSKLLQTSIYRCSPTAPASTGILLLPSVLRHLLLPTSYSLAWPAISGSSTARQKRHPKQPSHPMQQEQQRLHLEPFTVSWSGQEVAPHNAYATSEPLSTPWRQREAGYRLASRGADHRPCSSLRETLSAPVPATMPPEAPALFPATIQSGNRCSSASAIAAEFVHMEVFKYKKVSVYPPYITAALARRIAGISGAKLRLLQAASCGVATVQQLLPWSFRAAETVASLGFAGQLCAAIQLADISRVDIVIACAAFIAYILTQQGAVAFGAQAPGCWQLLAHQLRLRRTSAASGVGPTGLASDGDLALERGRKIQLEAEVRCLHSKLLQLLTVVKKQLERDGLPPPPAFLGFVQGARMLRPLNGSVVALPEDMSCSGNPLAFERLREGELPGDAVAALGQLLHQGRLQEAFSLVLREQEDSDKRRQQLKALGLCAETEDVTCDSSATAKLMHKRRNRLGASAYSFLNLAWPLLIQLQAALAVEAAEQRKQAATRPESAAAPATAAVEGMLATLQDIVARYEKATLAACSRDAQLVNLALKPAALGSSNALNLLANDDVADKPLSQMP